MKKKLIEVALPLEAINKEAAREKSIRHGHPSTLHLWWARRPLAACRAVLFASLVDDPSSHPEEFPTEADQDRERQRLFRLLEELVKWENSNNKQLFAAAHKEILKSTDGQPPPVYDPFCGGGSIPLEAQRLGLQTHASDLNPVAVLITKALIEIPPKFAGQPPVHPMPKGTVAGLGMWDGARGLAEDLRYYGQWMRNRAFERIGHLYPKVKLPTEHGGGEATVIAWLWTRTVQCPNPACLARMPLARSFVVSTKHSKTWVVPQLEREAKRVRFLVHTGSGTPPDPPKTGRGAKFKCLICQQALPDDYVKHEGTAGRIGQQLMAIVADGPKGRVYVSPSDDHEALALAVTPAWGPEQELADDPRNLWCLPYGLKRFRDLFTQRQLMALTTLCDLVSEARRQLVADGASTEYSDAVATYLGLLVSRLANTNCSLSVWSQSRDQSVNVFSRQALPMNWDFPEVNPFAGAAGDLSETAESASRIVAELGSNARADVCQVDATSESTFRCCLVATDPPYYDNIGYANLSDFFYVWQRRSLFEVYPQIFSTLLTPKAQELIAAPQRFDGKKELAREFFAQGFTRASLQMRAAQHKDFPLTVFYAFKQSESDEDTEVGMTQETASTGWETMLEGLLGGRFQVVGTWPVRSERPTGVKVAVNALASSIVLVCRPRAEGAPITTRKDFLALLKLELPKALRNLKKGNIAPVDLAQAAIGPGMAVFSRYEKVIESDGSPMRVRTALGLINQSLDEVVSEQEGEFDPDTRWALVYRFTKT